MHIILVLFLFFFFYLGLQTMKMKLLPNLEKKKLLMGDPDFLATALEVLLFTFIFLLNFSFSILLKGLLLKLIVWLFSTFNKITTPQKNSVQKNFWKTMGWHMCLSHLGLISLSNIELKWSHHICGVNRVSTTKLFYETTNINKNIHRPVNVKSNCYKRKDEPPCKHREAEVNPTPALLSYFLHNALLSTHSFDHSECKPAISNWSFHWDV